MNPAAGSDVGPATGGERMGNNNNRRNNGYLIVLHVPVLGIIVFFSVYLLLLQTFQPPPHDPIFFVSPGHHPYQFKFTTQKGTDFYVKTGRFEQAYPPDSPQRMKLEAQVETQYVSTYADFCKIEVLRFREGHFSKMPHCDLLKRYMAVAR
ncbi:hypothetical protein RHGRI_021411 [Rhododendron griersonianum]|uniref:Uncharacterized protein n=1 Tax=Rhododendron griersonianum TaxID=479676 RepID=A0AAV6JQX9_9ERIC|nr:hypothetical protein RHGRI_021411 [Rhododendron griersonianum]